MKYSTPIGVTSGLIIIAACFLPWSYIPSIQATLTGLQTAPTNFGKPGLLNIIFSALAVTFFIVPAVWAKRINIFLGAFNLAWMIRNFILFSQCELGECPDKRLGIYLVLFASVLLLVMALFPKETRNTSIS